MIVLDENILEGQRLLLEASRVAVRQIGVDIGIRGSRTTRSSFSCVGSVTPRFFTRDADFYQPTLRHRSQCLVVLSVGQYEVATFIRRFLRHTDFDTQSKRMGRVVRVSHAGVALWRLRSQREIHTGWSGPK